jgi:hypothetical protein
LGGAARADVLDPLHGYDIINGVPTQTSNGTISPLTAGDGFGFISDPADETGDFRLAVLVPTNETFIGNISVTGTSAGSGIFRGVWNTGSLEAFLGYPNGSPNNPIGAFTGGQDIGDPTVTGFAVFEIDLGSLTLLHTLAGDPMALFINGGLPAGTLIAGFLLQDGNTIDTAPSSVLATTVAVPGPLVGAGLPGLIAALMAMFGINRHRRRRNGAFA